MFAVISDIHGNLEALDAVLADIAARGVTSIYCLGDLVGYGPNPAECVKRAMTWDATILGNHDEAVARGVDGFGRRAARSLDWTRRLFRQRPELAAFLAARPPMHRTGKFLFVHGTPRCPTAEYLYPEDVRYAQKMTEIAGRVDRNCFIGHTHIPGVFAEPFGTGGNWQFFSPDEIGSSWRLNTRKTIVNVGSVGQPRDKDTRACYVTVNEEEVTFHRVEYDFEATAAKIRAIPELSNSLCERLREAV